MLIGNSDNEFPLYNGVTDYTHTFSPFLLNSARLGASYFPVTEGYTNPTGQNLPSVFGIAGTAPDQTFLPQQIFQGGNSNGPALGSNNLVSQFHDTVVQVQDTVTIVHGKHTVNVGFQYYNYRTNVLYVGNSGLAGQFIYDGSFTGNPSIGIPGATGTTNPVGMAEADFLLGLPQNVGLGSGGGRSLRNSLVSAFAQDDWHIASNLTLNLGLRYEVVTPRAEAHNQATNYGLFTGTVQLAGQNGNSSALYNQYNGATNFQPRIGVSWQPEFDKASVVRAAYGISNFTESTGTGNLLIQNPPFAIPHNVTYNGSSVALSGSTLDQGFSTFPSSGCTAAAAVATSPLCFSGTGIHAFDPNNIRPSGLAAVQPHRAAAVRQLIHLPGQLRRTEDRPSHDDRAYQPAGTPAEWCHRSQSVPQSHTARPDRSGSSDRINRLLQLQRSSGQRPAASQPRAGTPGELHLVQVHGQLLRLLRPVRRYQRQPHASRQQPLLLPGHLSSGKQTTASATRT